MELKPHYDILIPGNYFCDIVFTGLPAFPELGKEIYTQAVSVVPGGGALNTTIVLRRLGVNAGWMGKLGDDFFSQFVAQYLEAEGIDMSLLTRTSGPMRRVTVALSCAEDRAFVSYVDPSPNSVDLAYHALERATFSHLHFSSLITDERLPDLLDLCRERDISVSMDCQHREQTLADFLVWRVISRLDLFMPNAVEAQRLTGYSTLSDALDVLADLVPFVVVKYGANGAIARQDGVDYQSPAVPSMVLDTTGAGDAFNAGFLAALVAEKGPEECLRWGNFCGGMSVRGMGGTSTAPTRAQLDDWLNSQDT